jgi:translocation and assembly module TamB
VTEASAKAPRRWWKYLLIVFLVGALFLTGIGWYMTTDSFQAYVRRRLVSVLETMTGTRVELGAYHAIPFRLQVEVRDLTLHGREAPGEIPLAHVDSLVARIKVISLLETQFGFDAIILEHPVVHVIVYPDGSTNQPSLPLPRSSGKTPVEQLFSLSIHRVSVRNGQVVWNDRILPLDFDARDISVEMLYSFLHRRYETSLLLGQISTKLRDFGPLACTLGVQLSLARNSVEISTLLWNTAHSRLEASGRIEDFRNPRIEASYRATLDLGEAASIAQVHELRKGMLQFEGQGVWSAQAFSSMGKLSLSGFDWQNRQLTLRDASFASDFSFNRQQARLTRMQGRLLGGSLSGDGELTNWLSGGAPAPTARGKAIRPPAPNGTVHLQLAGIAWRAVGAALGTPAHPWDRAHLVGAVDGTVDLRWKGSLRNADLGFALAFTPPPNPSPAELPLAGDARGAYHAAADELELAQFALNTRFSQLRASGSLAETSLLKISAEATDLSEWQAVIAALRGPERLPITLHGSASFNGIASGQLSSPTLAGHLGISDFDSLIPASARAPEHAVHWDSFAADVQLSPHGFAVRHARLHRGDATARFDLSAGLTRGRFTAADPFTASATLRNLDLSELMSLAGYEYPVSGRLNLQLEAGGTRAEPHAEGHFELSDGFLYGEPVQHLDTDLSWTSAGEVSFNNLRLTYRDTLAAGGAVYDPSTRAFHFNLAGSNLDLFRFPQLQERFPVEGHMDFTAQGSGTLDEPAINATFKVRDLTLDHERAGDLTLDAVTHGSDMRLTVRSDFEHARLDLDGSIHLRDDFPADLALEVEHLDVDSVLRSYLPGRITGHSTVSGDVQVRGPLREPRRLTLVANLGAFQADLTHVQLHNQGPIRFTLADEVLRIEELHLAGESTDFSAHGTVALTGDRPLDLAAKGGIDLQLLQTLNPGFTSSGQVEVTVTTTGPAADPVLEGRVSVSHAAIAYLDLPSGLSDMNGSLVFNQNRLQVENLTAHSGGGDIVLTGEVSSYAGQINFDLSATGRGVRLRYPPGVSSVSDAQLRFYGTPQSSNLTGDITVQKIAVTPGFDFASYAATRQSVITPSATSPLQHVKLDVHVLTAPDLQMQTALARLSGDADLRLRGTLASPALLGRVDTYEGEINFNGSKFRLERGEILFKNPVGIQPVLDLQATTRVRDYDITVTVNGTTDKPNIDYRSDPPMAKADIIALLALGQTPQESAQLTSTSDNLPFGGAASNLILSQALNATVSNRMQRLFGVSNIRVDPQGLSTETNPTRGPQVTIEQQISHNFTLTYSQNVSQASQQIIQGEYFIRRNLSIVGTRDQNGVVSFDVKIRQRRR